MKAIITAIVTDAKSVTVTLNVTVVIVAVTETGALTVNIAQDK